MKLINKYLVTEKVSREDAVKKVIKTIKSITDKKQMPMAAKMIDNFMKMYGDEFTKDVKDELFGIGSDLDYTGLDWGELAKIKYKNNLYKILKSKKK